MRRSLRFKKKIFALLAIVSLLTCLFPMGALAADASITATKVPVLKDGIGAQTFGTIKIIAPAGAVSQGDSVYIKLPSGIEYGSAFGAPVEVAAASNDNEIIAPDTYDGDINALDAVDLAVYAVGNDMDEIRVVVVGAPLSGTDAVLLIQLGDMDVDSGENGPVEVTVDPSNNSGFPSGTVTVAKINSSGIVNLSLSGADTSDDQFDFDLRMKEEVAGSLEVGNKSLKAKLPTGFVWTGPSLTRFIFPALWGSDIVVNITKNDEEAIVDFLGANEYDSDGDGVADALIDANADGVVTEAELAAAQAAVADGDGSLATCVASAWEGTWTFEVDDESKLTPGDVICTLSGKTTTNATQAPVGTYGEKSVAISAASAPTLIAGRDEQEIGDIVIKESLAHSLSDSDTVTLTLPEGARWQQAFENNDAPEDLDNFTSDENLQLTFDRYQNDNRTAKFSVPANHESNDSNAEIKLENVEVALAADFSGDLTVEVGGTSPLKGSTIVVGKVVGALTAAAASVPEVKIGLSDQTGGEITITEQAAGAFNNDELDGRTDDGIVRLVLPSGVTFASTPKVEVTSGDMKIDNVKRAESDSEVRFTVDNESTTASTITVSGVSLKVNRDVPEGDITIKIKGGGAEKTSGYEDWDSSDTVAKVAIAKVVTPAPGATKADASFVIGSTTYKVGGVEMTMDVAPYVKDGRTYLPVRYVAQSLGVADANILWDGVSQKVTLIKDGTVVQLTIGSNMLLVNGAAIPMDAAPELTSDRTMLPIRFVAQAFGASVGWDEATQTVTLK